MAPQEVAQHCALLAAERRREADRHRSRRRIRGTRRPIVPAREG